MKAGAKYVRNQLLALLLFVPVAFAQTESPVPVQPAQEVPVFTQQELDQMLAPIALYPDSLLSQILMASTYPLEVVAAARWSRSNSNLVGEQAVKAVDDRNWDPSVKSLVAFPQILTMMDEKLEWTERLGDAFLAQQSQVMDTVQNLRQKAYAAGNLKSSDQYRVVPQGQTIVVESPNPEVIYVPYYDPLIVYGAWWWPYPPVFWAPWPGYYAYPGFIGFRWSVGIVIGPRFFFGAFNWHERRISVVDARPFYYHRVDRRPLPVGHVWQHDPDHRRGVVYRSPSVRERFVRTNASPEGRREFRGHIRSLPEGRTDSANRPDARGGREEHGSPPRHDGGADARVNTPTVRTVPKHENVPGTAPRSGPEQRPNVFEGVGRGQDERNSSERGRSSSQGRGPDSNNAPASQSPGRVFAPRSSGGPRDPGESHRR